MRSSTSLKKKISVSAVLMIHLGTAASWAEWNVEDAVGGGSSLMGTMVNLCVGIGMAPPLIDTSIVPEVPGVLYALFDYGLTFSSIKINKTFYFRLSFFKKTFS